MVRFLYRRKGDAAMKYVFVTGGVLSSLGKGIASASIGCLLEARGIKVNFLKLDPYINVDPGTMSPFQHGEVFVTDDGAETDLDLGHYERFTSVRLTRDNNSTTGKIYQSVIEKERKGEYLGKTVQVIPHITNEIKAIIRKIARDVDVAIVEIGGTVGDIESLPFLEAIRQMRNEVGKENSLFVHLTLVPFIGTAGELKTKPTQHSVKELREIGIQPDILLCRTGSLLPKEVKSKIALFCNVSEENVITALDVNNIYEVPLVLHDEGLDHAVISHLKLPRNEPDLAGWKNSIAGYDTPAGMVHIAIVGKYVEFSDSYKSLNEALCHGGLDNRLSVQLHCVESEALEEEKLDEQLASYDGILVPGGFGKRGIEGMLLAAKYARTRKVPYFGICLGMECAVIEYARNVCGLQADSSEFDPTTPHRVFYMLRELLGSDIMGGNMRLGAYPCVLDKDSLAFSIYRTEEISERHRHRYEFNREYEEIISNHGMRFSGNSPDGNFAEIVEIKDHPWFLGCQFHPEFKSRPLQPHPLFTSFIAASYKYRCAMKGATASSAHADHTDRIESLQ
jgi:CTP synthase